MGMGRGDSSDLEGDAVLALLKIKGQGGAFARKSHKEKYLSR